MEVTYEDRLREGLTLFRLGSHDAALDAFMKAADLDPTRATAFHNAGVVLDALGRPAQAIAQLQRAVGLDPDHYEAAYNLAFITGREDREAGIQAWTTFLERWPDDENGKKNLAHLRR